MAAICHLENKTVDTLTVTDDGTYKILTATCHGNTEVTKIKIADYTAKIAGDNPDFVFFEQDKTTDETPLKRRKWMGEVPDHG